MVKCCPGQTWIRALAYSVATEPPTRTRSQADSELRAVGAAAGTLRGAARGPAAWSRFQLESESGPLAARAKPPDSAGVRETPGGAGPGPPEGCRYEFKFDSELTTCQSKQISVADAARSRRLSPTAQSSVPLGRSLEAALRRSPSKHISVADAAGTPLARRAQSHCGSYETEILIGAGATGWAF